MNDNINMDNLPKFMIVRLDCIQLWWR
jgi:hypothetical protein